MSLTGTQAPRPALLLPQYLEERGAVALQLDRADAGEAQHLLLRARHELRHLAEDGVAEDDVGGHALGVGEALAPGAQALEQLGVRDAERRGDVARLRA